MGGQVAGKAFAVPSGKDRSGTDSHKIWGLIPLATKLSSADTGGDIYIFEHHQMGKGGPPRHIHHDQDEWFYIVRGEFIFEVGDERFHASAGDSLFGPRQVPHAWACISDEPGTLLTMVSPAGTFETFLRDTTRHATIPPDEDIQAAFTAHNMTVVGPPLPIDDL